MPFAFVQKVRQFTVNVSFDIADRSFDPTQIAGLQAFDRIKGQVTASKVRVLSANVSSLPVWLWTVTFYDDRGRVIQVQTDNHMANNTVAGLDILTTEYDFAGKVLQTKLVHHNPNMPQDIVVQNRSEYNHLQMPVRNYQQVDSEAEVLISEMTYNELGTLVQKDLGIEAGTPLESIDYRYNIRGWMTHINDPNQNNKLFAQQLFYNETAGLTGENLQYNGNIQAITWKSSTDQVARSYVYGYDKLNRLTNAQYEAPTSTLGEDFTVSNITYDANGNILTLARQGLIDPINTGFGAMDNLQYSYAGNQLVAVDDLIETTDPNTHTGKAHDFTDYSPNTLGGTKYDGTNAEYIYDVNGNMMEDRNKGIESISYNHLNLPTDIYFSTAPQNYIHYIYDAAGIKLRKQVFENGSLITQTDYVGGIIYEDNQPQFMAHSEGRYLFDFHGSSAYEYQYKDHLGNLRLSFRKPENQTWTATMENNSEANEFAHYFTTKSAEQAYFSAHSSKTDPNTPIGLWKSMPITKGDVLNVSAHSFFNQDANTNHNAFDVNIFVNNTLNTYNLDENGNFVPAPFSLDNLSLGIGIIPSNPNSGNNLPDAGFVLVFYEAGNDSIPIHQERVYVSQKNTWQSLVSNYTATHTGRVEVFCFNTADIPVYFDNFTIDFNPTMIVQENHYFPFGMNLAGIEKQGMPEDKFQYNGKEKQMEFGLNWSDYGARNNDVQLGRWHSVDPLAEKAYHWTPYRYAFNNPLKFIDPDGKWEFETQRNEEGKATNVQLNAQKGDSWKTFKKQTGLGKKELTAMFGKDYKTVLDGYADSGTIQMEDISGSQGEMLQEMENAIVNLNDVESGGLSGNNCHGCSVQITRDGKINPDGHLNMDEFDEIIDGKEYINVASPKIGDIIRYGVDGPVSGGKGLGEHSAVFLLKNEKGTQIFTKNGYLEFPDYRPEYQIMYESSMLKEHPYYGRRRGLDKKINQTTTNSEGKQTVSTIVKEQRPYYRKKK